MAGIYDIQAYMPDELEDPGQAIPCQSRERNLNEISIITFERTAMPRVLNTLVWPMPVGSAVIPTLSPRQSGHAAATFFVICSVVITT
jgi:hypothetical protein